MYLFSWRHMRILTVLPTCCNGRVMRATRARALLLLFKPTAHQLPAQFSPVTLLPAKLGSIMLKIASMGGSQPVSGFPVLPTPMNRHRWWFFLMCPLAMRSSHPSVHWLGEAPCGGTASIGNIIPKASTQAFTVAILYLVSL